MRAAALGLQPLRTGPPGDPTSPQPELSQMQIFCFREIPGMHSSQQVDPAEQPAIGPHFTMCHDLGKEGRKGEASMHGLHG